MSFNELCAAVIASWWLIGLTGFLFLIHVEKKATGEDTDMTVDVLIGGVLVAWIPGPVYWLTLLTVTVVDRVGDHLVDGVPNFFLDRLNNRFVNRSGRTSRWNQISRGNRTASQNALRLLLSKHASDSSDYLSLDLKGSLDDPTERA